MPWENPRTRIALPAGSDSEAEGGSTAQHTVSRVTCPHAVAGRVSPGAGGLLGPGVRTLPLLSVSCIQTRDHLPEGGGRTCRTGRRPDTSFMGCVPPGALGAMKPGARNRPSAREPCQPHYSCLEAFFHLGHSRGTWCLRKEHLVANSRSCPHPWPPGGEAGSAGGTQPLPGRDCSLEGSWERRPVLGSRITMFGRTHFTALGCRVGLLLRPLPTGTGKSEPIWSTHCPGASRDGSTQAASPHGFCIWAPNTQGQLPRSLHRRPTGGGKGLGNDDRCTFPRPPHGGRGSSGDPPMTPWVLDISQLAFDSGYRCPACWVLREADGSLPLGRQSPGMTVDQAGDTGVGTLGGCRGSHTLP